MVTELESKVESQDKLIKELQEQLKNQEATQNGKCKSQENDSTTIDVKDKWTNKLLKYLKSPTLL